MRLIWMRAVNFTRCVKWAQLLNLLYFGFEFVCKNKLHRYMNVIDALEKRNKLEQPRQQQQWAEENLEQQT